MKNLDLQEIRGQLDTIDGQILELFEKRMQLCGDVAAFKIGTGKAVYDGEREQQKLNALMDMAEGEFNKKGVYELFSQIMTISRRLQYRLLAQNGKNLDTGFTMVDELKRNGVKIAYQGVEGSYGHGAALQYFGENAQVYHVAAMEDAMVEVEEGRADYAVLPIENSSAGAVSDNYDLLVKHNVYIVAETQLPVNHALLGLPGASLEDIRQVYSHPQALMQCSQYLNAHRKWRQVSMENTAVAAKKVLEEGDVTQAAVASEIAGRLYGLKVLEPSINHNKNNTTRFIILARTPIYRKDASKVSICFEGAHKSGSLYNMLGNLIYNGVNMLMIESRPIEGRSWEYRFFVDAEGSLSDEAIQNALTGISKEAASLRILGNY
ncbi:prephenate dehydratase [Lacrimispora sp. 210928-DFI.3.58]|uniref:prephenate dehydratase n=1 Tax=Lacrimispora sp. 210928-DFI.3.58 TaxID=2883214 RepID=UPI0015B5E58E|nr:prephenate dehydratase [Lacrimispora sp. 210928-DFI.3.58]MCB7320941.1 prephenate dehydratase [Lacrimispora sp. 210928-DFI.3.58]